MKPGRELTAPAPTLSARPGRELPAPKAQTIFVLGVMGYRRHPAAPGATFAMISFDALLALAKSRGFKGSKQIKGAVRRGKATAFAMDKAQALAALVTDAEFQREIASLSFWDGVRPPAHPGNRPSSSRTSS